MNYAFSSSELNDGDPVLSSAIELQTGGKKTSIAALVKVWKLVEERLLKYNYVITKMEFGGERWLDCWQAYLSKNNIETTPPKNSTILVGNSIIGNFQKKSSHVSKYGLLYILHS